MRWTLAICLLAVVLIGAATEVNDVGARRLASASMTSGVVALRLGSVDASGATMDHWDRATNFTVMPMGSGSGTMTIGIRLGSGWSTITVPDDVTWDRNLQFLNMASIRADSGKGIAAADTICKVTCSSAVYLVLGGQ